MRQPFQVIFLMALLSGCAVLDETGPQRGTSVYVRVKPRGENSAWLLERALGDRAFKSGTVILYGPPQRGMHPHKLGALPLTSGVFRLWEGIGGPHNAPLPTQRRVFIPAAGGPWRGVVVELHSGVRYPAAWFSPLPGQPIGERPVATEVLYCQTANILACVPWTEAVTAGWVTCETSRRGALPVSTCRTYVPYTRWTVDE